MRVAESSPSSYQSIRAYVRWHFQEAQSPSISWNIHSQAKSFWIGPDRVTMRMRSACWKYQALIFPWVECSVRTLSSMVSVGGLIPSFSTECSPSVVSVLFYRFIGYLSSEASSGIPLASSLATDRKLHTFRELVRPG